MSAETTTSTELYALREQVRGRTAGYAVQHPHSGKLVSNRSFENGHCVRPLVFPLDVAQSHQVVLSANSGVAWVVELAPGPCPSCGRAIRADDLDFAYPNRARTRYRAGCNLHDFGCGFEVESDSFEGFIRRWNGQ